VPDLDFVLSYLALGTARPMHGTITHSIAFAVLGALALAYFRWFGDYRRSAILGLALLGSHAVMDWLAGPSVGRSTGIGVMLLYPFSLERFGAPLKLFIGPRHRTLEALLSLHNVIAVLWEVLLLAPVAAWLEWRRRRDVP
jgi:inner membrane protein